ncbi:MAG TPA: tripartite tricarboxylate transporter substrate binding protein [Ramlibacter sp.]|nr:tripartite tricarboxylate transporter substrate binding protein [Ramlibacter sp.]
MTRSLHRRSCLRVALGAAALVAGARGHAQGDPARFPDKPVRIVLPYPPGGLSDVLARFIGQKLSERWRQQVVVDNRPGGGTVPGASAVQKSAPDGLTLLLHNNTHVINAHLIPNLPYSPIRDFTPVSMLATSAYLMLAKPQLPARTFQEFVALAKAEPSKFNFGTHGPGGLTHVAAEMLNAAAGIRMEIVQYKGAGPALNGILAGDIDVYFDAPATTLQHVQSGRLRALGISGRTRLPSLPQVPTLAEAGVSGYDVTIWYGLLGPAGVPEALVTRINNDVGAVLAQPDVRERLESLGVGAFPLPPASFAQLMRSDDERYGRIIRQANIKAG